MKHLIFFIEWNSVELIKFYWENEHIRSSTNTWQINDVSLCGFFCYYFDMISIIVRRAIRENVFKAEIAEVELHSTFIYVVFHH